MVIRVFLWCVLMGMCLACSGMCLIPTSSKQPDYGFILGWGLFLPLFYVGHILINNIIQSRHLFTHCLHIFIMVLLCLINIMYLFFVLFFWRGNDLIYQVSGGMVLVFFLVELVFVGTSKTGGK